MDLQSVLEPVVEAAGLELVEVRLGREAGRRVLRVTVDREGGVDLGAIAEASERISRRLDVEGFDPGRYELEVSSPGVERPLRTARDFERRVGERVKVRTTQPIDGSRTHVGTLTAVREGVVTIATDQGERTVTLDEVASARTVFVWGEDGRRK